MDDPRLQAIDRRIEMMQRQKDRFDQRIQDLTSRKVMVMADIEAKAELNRTKEIDGR